MPPLPVARDHLSIQGVSPAFMDYLAGFSGFLATDSEVRLPGD